MFDFVSLICDTHLGDLTSCLHPLLFPYCYFYACFILHSLLFSLLQYLSQYISTNVNMNDVQAFIFIAIEYAEMPKCQSREQK